MPLPTRGEALGLLHEWVASGSLRRHMYATEAAMRAYARRHSAEEELYGLTGLLHDFDYERFPDEHPHPGVRELARLGYPDELLHAVLAHPYPHRSETPPQTLLARTLRACDEMTGLVTAAALIRPSKSLYDLETASVMRRFKDRAFAAGIDREEVRENVAELGMGLREHARIVLEAMREIAPELGLEGEIRPAR